MNPQPTVEQVRAPLMRAQTFHAIRLAARLTCWTGLVIVLGELFCLHRGRGNPDAVKQISGFFLPLLGVLALGGLAAALYAWRRQSRIEAVARQAQKQFPELGLRLSASLEVPGMAYCPPSIRAALWQDTLAVISSVSWQRFVKRGATTCWALAACLLLVGQVAMVIMYREPSPKITVDAPKKTAVAKAADEKKADEKKPDEKKPGAKPKEPFIATLEVSDPGKDEWATKIEALPVSVIGKAPHGIKNLALNVSVNGEPPRRFAMDQETLKEVEGEATGSLFLDELELKDFDVVSYNVVGEAPRGDEAPVQVSSDLYFVQIRPFKKDTGICRSNCSKTAYQWIDVLLWLVEAQRVETHDTWVLGKGVQEASAGDANRMAGRLVYETQKNIAEQASHPNAFAGENIKGKAPPEISTALNKAREEMDLAMPLLKKKDWAAAIPHQHKAFSILAELLQHAQYSIKNPPPGAKPPAADAKEQPDTLKDRQTFRLAELQALANKQEEINKANEQAAKQTPSAESEAKKQELARQQRDLAKAAEAARKASETGQKAQQALDEAEQRMKQNAKAPSPQLGGQAKNLLDEAVVRQREETKADPPQSLHEMLGKLAAHQAALQGPGAPRAETQAAVAQDLQRMNKDLGELSELARKENKDSLNDAAQKAKAASEDFSKAKGSAATLDKPMDAIAQAYKQSMGQAEYLADMHKQLQEFRQQMEGLQQRINKQSGKDDGKSAGKGKGEVAGSPSSSPMNDLAQKQQQLNRDASETSPGKELANRQAALAKEAEALQKEASTLPEARITLAKAQDVMKQNAGAPDPELGKQAAKLLEEASAQQNPSQPPARNADQQTGYEAMARKRDPDSTTEMWVKQLRERANFFRVGRAVLHSEAHDESTARTSGGGGGIGEGWWTSAELNETTLADWIREVQSYQEEIVSLLDKTSDGDALKAMRDEDVPPEYRDLVNAYFEKLSRESLQKPKAH